MCVKAIALGDLLDQRADVGVALLLAVELEHLLRGDVGVLGLDEHRPPDLAVDARAGRSWGARQCRHRSRIATSPDGSWVGRTSFPPTDARRRCWAGRWPAAVAAVLRRKAASIPGRWLYGGSLPAPVGQVCWRPNGVVS
jgi:hypothetical protein